MAAQSTTHKAQSPPPTQLRHRPLGRASTLADVSSGPTLRHRRSSLFSDRSMSASFKSSMTEDLYPRANGAARVGDHQETSHWHSVPLGLALLPAVGGLLFKNGSAVITDVTLLALAAVFLNWSVRLPWEWYASSQAVQTGTPQSPSFEAIVEESGDDDENQRGVNGDSPSSKNSRQDEHSLRNQDDEDAVSAGKLSAQKELRVHELVALLTCFLGPAVGAWLLHAIRSQLSRPSEGLVSNYNLTVFLLAAEIRPMSHLIKLIQERTLHLQRIVMAESLDVEAKDNQNGMMDIVRRLEELETHIAESTDSKAKKSAEDAMAAKTASQVTSEVRRGMQPELDALNRAVRRYEKRTTITTIQTDARLQDLESRLKDAIVLAAAAQRDVERKRNSFSNTLYHYTLTALSLPNRLFWTAVKFPIDVFSWAARTGSNLLTRKSATQYPTKRGRESRPRDRERKVKAAP